MPLKATVEWWKEGLSPRDTIAAWSTAATTSVIIAVLLEDKLQRDGRVEVEGTDMVIVREDAMDDGPEGREG